MPSHYGHAGFGPAQQPLPPWALTQTPQQRVGPGVFEGLVGNTLSLASDIPGVPTPLRLAGNVAGELIASGAFRPPVLTTAPTPSQNLPLFYPPIAY